VFVTVAICTRNRSRALERTLRSVAAAALPASLSWEVLVVDNGSDDDTANVIARLSDALPVRAFVEPHIGLSHARNAAIREARGDYLLWIDDDVLVDAQWLRAYDDAFRARPDIAFFGGPIVPMFEGTPPRWLRVALPNIDNAYAARDLGTSAAALTRETLPFGANFAVRADVQRRFPYDPELGRSGAVLSAGEEWAALEAILAGGESGLWVPGARVQHVISAERQSVRYLRRYYVENGMSLALTRREPGERLLFGRPRWAWREALLQELAYRARRVYASADVWSVHLRRASVAWGLLRVPARRRDDHSSTSVGGGR
jgi:glucosyl-dolichyl phosphate glucuronosyltransferase